MDAAKMSLPLEQLKFDASGLITAVVQDGLTGEVRMVAWMDPAALAATLATRRATFFSRSRQRLWVKGEESGNFLQVTDVLADCDGDTLLVLCEPLGPSCHTGQDNCFFRPLEASPSDAKSDKSEPARPLMGRLEAVLELRRRSPAEKSYTRSLLDGGAEKVGAKLLEEAGELGVALAAESDERVASEAADVLYHLLVGLRLRQVAWRDVLAVIGARFGVGGHAEKASRLGPG